MRCFVKYIMVIDNKDKIHFVTFNEGLNIITGKSSTGKSAMIEIFDYCFGNSDYTVPVGVITDVARIYCTVVYKDGNYLIVARRPSENKAFIKVENNDFVSNIDNFCMEYFNRYDFLGISDFNKELGHFFGLDITDVTEDEAEKDYRGRKKGRPSIRNVISYILQHQNLVANKHALFYRFDEKEKREQTIEQFKIFSGFVDQEYFVKKQELKKLERDVKQLELKQEREREYQNSLIGKLGFHLKEYHAVTGRSLETQASEMVKHPKQHLEKLSAFIVNVDYNSDSYNTELLSLKEKRQTLTLEVRNLNSKLNNINASINFAKQYSAKSNNLSNTIIPTRNQTSICPFCKTVHTTVNNEQIRLSEAIKWLNSELQKIPYFLDSFLEEKQKLENKIGEEKKKIAELNSEIDRIEAIDKNLQKQQSLERQAQKILYKIESFLENIVESNQDVIENEIKEYKQKIKATSTIFNVKYDISEKMKRAGENINKKMNEIGEKFDFEESYKPINLKFDLNTFDLYQERDGHKIFLRSMGSGANWLYCHLSLFLSLQYYFCSIGEKSIVPPVLFIDQPSQVYFPSIEIDEAEEFDRSKLKKDTDIEAVTNVYDQLVKFCDDTEKKTGIRPQIIVTDHADKLELKNGDFESLVNGRRWRKRGFIEK